MKIYVIETEGDKGIVVNLEQDRLHRLPMFTVTETQLHGIVAAGYLLCLNPYGIAREVHDVQAKYNWRTNLEIVCIFKGSGQIVLCPTGPKHAFYPNALVVPGMYPPPSEHPISFEELATLIFRKYGFAKTYEIQFPGLTLPNLETVPGPTNHTVVSCRVDEIPENARLAYPIDIVEGRVETLLPFHQRIVELGLNHLHIFDEKSSKR